MSAITANRFVAKPSKLNGSQKDKFQLWYGRVNTVPQSRKIARELEDEAADSNIDERALPIIMSGLGDCPFRAIQSCTTTMSAWENTLAIRRKLDGE